MAGVKVSGVVRHLRRVADAQQNRERTDRELLQSFVAQSDQAAFATLLRRHGPMVLRVCRRALRQEQDAEDAFQATFLVLARRAGSIRKQEALASWLHGVAHHVALRARRDATKRHAREREARPMTPKTVTAEVDWREAQAVLEEEIRNLPERCRAAFVLCFLEGRSRAETARELGLKEGTVWSRLTEARRLLQRRLRRRGISLTAVLGAAALSEGVARAVPARLVASTVQVAADVGTAPARVAALAEGVNKLMISTKLKSVILCLVTAGLISLGTVVAGKGDATGKAPQAPTAEKKSGPSAAAPARAQAGAAAPNDAADKKAEDVVRLSGRVVGPDGKPVAGAELTLWWHFGYEGYYRDWHPATAGPFRPKPLARSDAGGRFTATFRKSELTEDPMSMWDRPWRHAQVVAAAPGYGPDWATVAAFAKGELVLRLVKDDVSVKGRVLSLEGRPVAGVAVRVVRVTVGKDVHNSLWQTSWAGLPQDLKTGPDGRFTLRGVGRDRTALLSLEGPSTEQKLIAVGTAPAEGRRETEVFLGPTRPVEGTVRDKSTGRPVAGVVVYGDEAGHHRRVRAVSNAQGNYRLVGLPSAGSYGLTTYPPVSTGYLGTLKRVAGREGLAPLKADLALRRGVKLSCRLVDRHTRQPVHGVLHYTPLGINPLYPEAELDKGYIPSREFSRLHVPDPAGVYHLVAYPGPGLLTCNLQANQGKYLPVRLDPADRAKAQGDGHLGFVEAVMPLGSGYRLIDPKATDKRLEVEIELDPGRAVKGSLVSPDGKPLAGAEAYGLHHHPTERRATDGAVAERLEKDAFTATLLDPRWPRTVSFVHRDRRLVGHAVLRGDEKAPVTVRLQPWAVVSGRLVGRDGKPVPAARVGWRYPTLPPPGMASPDRQTVTDADGRFRVEGLAPGLPLTVSLKGAAGPGEAAAADSPLSQLTLQAGQTRSLGDVRMDILPGKSRGGQQP